MSLTLSQVQNILQADIIVGESMLDKKVEAACGADLMSDVLSFVGDKTMLLTGLNNPHVIRTAEMLDVTAIVFVRGKWPGQDIIDMAIERSIVLFSTTATLYEACGKLYKAGLPGKSERTNAK